MLMLFLPERPGQTAGFPWLASSILRLRHLGAYEEAEVVAARMGAAKMGFLEPQANAAPPGYNGETTPDGNKYMEVSPGSIEQLPMGYTFKAFDPTHPNAAFKDFVKATLRGISAGLGVSYTSLANDLESVNYSSIRAGLLEEREEWKRIQGWFIGWFLQPIFDKWLEMALSFGRLTDGQLTLPAGKIKKFNAPEWKPRRWGWVDPLADLQAQVLAVEKGFKSRREIIAENGGDIEVVFSDIEADEALEEKHGLDFDESDEQANEQQSKPDSPDDVDKGKELKT
jgi:lambda family phage portal protein